MLPSGLQVNWDNVAFNSTTIDRVTNVGVSFNVENIEFKGDTAIYPELIVNVNNRPVMTITSGNAGVIMALPVNTPGVVTATHKDAEGAVGGDIVYEMDSILTSKDSSGAHAAFGTAAASFTGVSPDGVTNPLAFTRA